MTKRINIIDADTLCVSSAAQVQKNTLEVIHKATGKSKEFKNITELKSVMKAKGTLDQLDTLEIKTKVEVEPVEFALSSVKRKLERINDAIQADKTIIVVGGKATYRQALPLPSPYKNNRSEKPVHLAACKEYLVKHKGAYVVNGIEADDETTILSEEYKKDGWEVFLSSPDHDSFQMHGITLFNYKEDDPIKATIDLDGHWFDVIKKGTYNKSVGSGVGYLAGAMLYGDPTDTYNPTEIVGIRYGMMAAKKDLASCKEPKDFLSVVKEKYQEWYPNDVTYTAWDGKTYVKNWREILQMFFQCAYMLRSRDDEANAKKFFAYYGVKL